VKAELALSERAFRCEACGLVIARDRNAAKNLEHPAKAACAVRRSPRETPAWEQTPRKRERSMETKALASRNG